MAIPSLPILEKIRSIQKTPMTLSPAANLADNNWNFAEVWIDPLLSSLYLAFTGWIFRKLSRVRSLWGLSGGIYRCESRGSGKLATRGRIWTGRGTTFASRDIIALSSWRFSSMLSLLKKRWNWLKSLFIGSPRAINPKKVKNTPPEASDAPEG